KKVLPIFLLISSVLITTFCTQEKLEPGIPVNFDSIQAQEYEPVMEKGLSVGKNISIEGYLSLQNLMSLQSNTIMVNLFEEKESKGKSVSVSLPVGEKENQMEGLPNPYKEEDLKVHTNLKEIVGPNDKVRIHGIRLGSSLDNTVYVQSIWIEKVLEK
ncbi:hypothetical protein EBU71_21365, partial [bacterium]|nr:hypothetical protein [Candidatus Elulimicrobium humile]